MQPVSEIRRIGTGYLDILESYLPDLWKEYEESGLTPVQFLQEYSSKVPSASGLQVIYEGRRWSSLSYQSGSPLGK